MDLPPAEAAPNEGPLPAYRAMPAAGTLHPDPAQARAAEVLQDPWLPTTGHRPPPQDPAPARLFAPLLRPNPLHPAEPPARAPHYTRPN